MIRPVFVVAVLEGLVGVVVDGDTDDVVVESVVVDDGDEADLA